MKTEAERKRRNRQVARARARKAREGTLKPGQAKRREQWLQSTFTPTGGGEV